MLRAAQYNIHNAYRRSIFRQSFVWEQPASTPVNLTGYGGRLSLFYIPGVSPPPPDPMTDLALPFLTVDQTNGGFVLTTPVSGAFDIVIDDSIMTNILEGRYRYVLELVPPSGDAFRILQGQITVS